jgi:hypothetical protein
VVSSIGNAQSGKNTSADLWVLHHLHDADEEMFDFLGCYSTVPTTKPADLSVSRTGIPSLSLSKLTAMISSYME